MAIADHRAASPAPGRVRVAVLTVSDTRALESDEGGALIEALTREQGFTVVSRSLVPDEIDAIRERVLSLTGPTGAQAADVVLLTGGTGIAPRDVTVEAVEPLFQRRLDGFGELFRMLSYAEIGSAAMLSRACAGVIAGPAALFLLPGSPAAIRLALRQLILPELAHIAAELQRGPQRHQVDRGSGTHGHHHG